jgi:SAM-dependent methyltransferase
MPFGNQFDFQHARARGRILNVGCDADTSGLKAKRGAVNVDIWDHNPHTGMVCPADIIADARELPEDLHGRFDTVILGDILEHFIERDDVLKVLEEAKKCLAPGGQVLVSCPEDHRESGSQGFQGDEPMYMAGVRAYHAYPVTRETILAWLEDAGLAVEQVDVIQYPFTPHGGTGVVAKLKPQAEANDVHP